MAENLFDQADYFRSIVVSSPDCVRVIDLQGRIEFSNPSGLKLMAQTQERFDATVRGQSWVSRWPASERAVVEAAWSAAAAGEARSFRACHLRQDGVSLWLDTTVAPVFASGADVVTCVVATSRDVTEEVESRALLDTILDCVPAALFAKELESGRMVFLNEHAERLFGFPAGAMVGRDASDFVLPSQAEAIRQADFEAADTDRTVLIDNEFVTQKDGRTSIRRTLKKATPRGLGARHVVCLTEDITEEIARAEALTRAVEEAEAASRAKSQFLAVMSHEIRSPLNGVLGMAQAMEMDELPPRQRERLKVVREAGRLLLNLLNDMLDLSRISAGGMQLEDGVVEAQDMASAARNLFQGLAADKDLSFELTVDPAAQGAWRGDPTRIRQIITNLIGNAVKFTDRGRVVLDIRAADQDQDQGLVLAVTDTGPGIPHGKLGRIFDPFDQLDPSNTRRHGGSGLGLSICRSLVEMMGGSIEVSSEEGVGSTFTVRLPLARAERQQAPTAPEEAKAGALSGLSLRILAAEDNPMNQLVLTTLMGALGLDPYIVANGEEAVRAYQREPWDLILMDVQMPVMDGPGATVAIRAIERREGRARTPIIALTANAMEHQLAAYVDCGMDAVVSKPIEASALIEAVLTHGRPQAVIPDEAPKARKSGTQPLQP
jgi:PAS domain S-box-containing protein